MDLKLTYPTLPCGRFFTKEGVRGYRFGFNGKEKVDEVYGDANAYDFGARLYDPRLGRWLAVDPNALNYPAISAYVFALNSPLLFKDPDGKDAIVTVQKDPNGGGKITISAIVYITGDNVSQYNVDLFNEKANSLYKSGEYTDECGEVYKIEFNIKFEYVEDASAIELKRGENILNYGYDNNNESHVKDGSSYYKNADGEISVTSYTGTKGEINKGDAAGRAFKPTLHEVLHFLGLSDRYDRQGTGTKAHEGFENDIMGSVFGTEINQTHYDNYGEKYSKFDSGEYLLDEYVDKKDDGSLKGGKSNTNEDAKEVTK